MPTYHVSLDYTVYATAAEAIRVASWRPYAAKVWRIDPDGTKTHIWPTKEKPCPNGPKS